VLAALGQTQAEESMRRGVVRLNLQITAHLLFGEVEARLLKQDQGSLEV
jgi:hypothetical protein